VHLGFGRVLYPSSGTNAREALQGFGRVLYPSSGTNAREALQEFQ